MPEVARGNSVDSVTTNHGCIGSTTTSGMSGDVIINGTGVHRKTDATVSHAYPPEPPCAPHTPTIATGSTTVFANNLGVARKGDDYTASDVVASGSANVFAGP